MIQVVQNSVVHHFKKEKFHKRLCVGKNSAYYLHRGSTVLVYDCQPPGSIPKGSFMKQ